MELVHHPYCKLYGQEFRPFLKKKNTAAISSAVHLEKKKIKSIVKDFLLSEDNFAHHTHERKVVCLLNFQPFVTGISQGYTSYSRHGVLKDRSILNLNYRELRAPNEPQ